MDDQVKAADDTVFALSTAPGRAGIAVVRVSGPRAAEAARTLAGNLPGPRRAALRRFRDGDGEVIDAGLLLWFAAPHTETGEDMAEFHLHGSRAVVDAMLARLGGLPGLRPAEAGEFARLAFANGKLDLTAVEGLADLVAAETAAQRRQALTQLDGALGRLYHGWRERVLHARARVEAAIDFADEDDVPEDGLGETAAALEALAGEMARHLDDARRGERLRDGATVVVAGPPNAGKSSLVNAVARRDVAIVTDVAGTTRDAIEVRLDLGGVPVTLVDTAGIREAGDAIEAEGVRRALARAAAADLVLWIHDARAPEAPGTPETLGPGGEAETLCVANKIDLVGGAVATGPDGCAISVRTGEGLDGLLADLEGRLRDRFAGGTDAGITRARHRAGVEAARGAVEEAGTLLAGRGQEELAAEALRAASDALGRIVGASDVEDVLDVIFSEFCIGK